MGGTQTSRNMRYEHFVTKLVSTIQTPSQQESLIKRIPPYTFGELCCFENALTYIISWDPWDNLILPARLSELLLTGIWVTKVSEV